MGPLDFLWHVLNLLAVSLLYGTLATAGAKILFHDALVDWTSWRLAGCMSAAAASTTVAGLLVLGQDGRMATYGAMVLAGAAVLAWAGRRKFFS